MDPDVKIPERTHIRSYELQERIGKGGFGEVYRATQPHVGRDVAIKIIIADQANQPEFIRNFETEAKMVARLEHPHIVPLFDYWREPNGAYIVMRYLRGGTLKNEMAQGPMPLSRIAEILDQLCGALWIAHRNRVAHRDIKPANIMLDDDRQTYLSDFGLAINIGDDHYKNLVGTWLYMAPERIQSQPQTHTVDIYSLGIMVFEMITGAYPFQRTSIDRIAYEHMHTVLPRLENHVSDLPEELNFVLQRATAKDPESRYEDIRLFAKDFREIVQPNGNRADMTQVMHVVDQILNPYMGLRPFSEADTEYFFGRIALVQRLLDRLKEESALAQFLALVGPSGSGKSSVIYAGLLPQLRMGAIEGSSEWYMITMTPGTHPFQNLQLALHSIAAVEVEDFSDQLRNGDDPLSHLLPRLLGPQKSDHGLLLFIDQFEEIFTQVEDEDTRQAFLDLLTTTVTNPASNIRVIITLRADFYDQPLHYEEFGKLIQNRTEVILPLDTSELERAVTGPARRVGLQVESELVAEIISDVKAEPGALPLLQYTLTELFNRRKEVTLTLEAYRESGGVQGALARRADEVFLSLPVEQQILARQIFLKLVTLGDGTEDTRRRARISELRAIGVNDDHIQAVLDEFGKYRLLTFDRDADTREPTIEVAHEALIREWQRFQIWLDSSREDLRLQRLIASEIADWKASQEDSSYLLRGNRLLQFEEWMSKSNVVITPEEVEYVQASIKERQREEQIESARRQHELELERQSRRRLQWMVGLLLVGSVIGTVLLIGIYRQSQFAETARLDAVAHLRTANSSAFATIAQQALGEGNYSTALAFAIKAVKTDADSSIAQNTLYSVAYAPGITRIIAPGDREPVFDIDISKDSTLVMGVSGQTIHAYMNRKSAETRPGQPPLRWSDLTFEDAQPTIIRIWDRITGEEKFALTISDAPVTSAGFVPDGDATPTLAYSAQGNGRVWIWDINTGETVHELGVMQQGLTYLSITADGKTLVGTLSGRVADMEGDRIVVWDVETGEKLRVVEPHANGVLNTAVSGDGEFALSFYFDLTHVLWDVETGEVIDSVQLRQQEVRDPSYRLAMTEDGLYAISSLGTGEVYKVEVEPDGDDYELEVEELAVGTSDVKDLAISDTGDTLIIAQQDGIFMNWYIPDEELVDYVQYPSGRFGSVAIDPTGTYVVIGLDDGMILVWELLYQPPDIIATIGGYPNSKRATFLSTGDSDLPQVAIFEATPRDALELDSFLSIVDPSSGEGEELARWETPHNFPPHIVIADESRRYIATIARRRAPNRRDDGRPYTVVLWDMQEQEILAQFDVTHPPGDVLDAYFLPYTDSDSPHQIIVAGSAGVHVWDIESEMIIRSIIDGTPILNIEMSQDQKYLFATTTERSMYQWDYDSGELIHTYDLQADSELLEVIVNSTYVATTTRDNKIAIWDYETHELVTEFHGHNARPTTADSARVIDVSGDEYTSLVTGADDGTVLFWDIENLEAVGNFLYESRILGVEFNTDGNLLLITPSNEDIDIMTAKGTSDEEVLEFVENNRVIRDITQQDCVQFFIEDICAEFEIE